MGKHKIIKSAAAVALTASVVATAAPGASAASYKTNAKDQLVHTSTGKLVKGWKVFGGKLYKNGKLAPAKKYKIIGTGAAQKLFYGPTLKKGYKTANSKTLLFKDGKLADGWKQAGKNERLYKNGKLDKGYTVYTNVEGDKFLYQNGKLKKGQKTATRGGETLLFVDGKLAKGYVLHEASKTLFNNGKVAEGLVKYPETDGKFYNDGKLANGEINGAEYKDGVLVAKDIASVKAINDTTVEVTFKKDQKDVKASDFKIEGLEVKNAATKQGDDKIVILTTSKQEAGKEYTLVYKEADTKTFTAKSDVIPTAISTSTASVQGTVGKEVTLKAQVTVAEGQSKAGIPVTFNIDGANNSLNKDIVAEAYTDENGVATYSYTQYNTASDTVAIYATGKPADRALSTVYWGVKDQLTVVENDTKGSTLANGDSKQYKVTYLDENGKPQKNAELAVAFAENINVTSDKKVTATVKDTVTGAEATPYELADGTGKKVANVKTDENGVAIFTVTGTNTAVTPIVYKDNGDEILNARELQVKTSTVTFQGAQVTHQLALRADKESNYTATGTTNGRTYTLKVVDKDGKPYAGGLVNLAFNEDLDKDSKTNVAPTTTFEEVGTYDLLSSPVGSEAKKQIRLDSKGEAKFRVASGTKDTYATPIAWIDQNDGLNSQAGKFETGEPSIIGAITYFQDPAIIASKLVALDENGDEISKNTLTAGEEATFEYIATNQSDNDFPVAKEVTYTIHNTGAAPVAYTTVSGVGGVQSGTIEVGGKATVTVKVETTTPTPTPNSITVEATDPTSVKVEASGYSLKEITTSGSSVWTKDKNLGSQTQSIDFVKPASAKQLAINEINNGKGDVKDPAIYNLATGLTTVTANNLVVVQASVKQAFAAAEKAGATSLTAAEIKTAVEAGVKAYNDEQADKAQALVDAAKVNGSTSNPAAPVTGNLTLAGTNVTWSSNNTAVITDTGVVSRPAYADGNATVTLTATATVDGQTKTKTFTVVVEKVAASTVSTLNTVSGKYTISGTTLTLASPGSATVADLAKTDALSTITNVTDTTNTADKTADSAYVLLAGDTVTVTAEDGSDTTYTVQ